MKPVESRVEYVSCPLCKSTAYKILWEERPPFVKCRNCSFVYQNPRPFQDELLGRYDEEYFSYEQENTEQFFRLMMLGLKDVGFSEIQQRLFRDLNGPQAGSRQPAFLDVGCATGRLLEEMKQRGWDSSGIEPCAPAARYGREKRQVRIHTGTLDTADYEDASFDFIHNSHVIEHVNDPRGFVRHMFRLNRPGGYAAITTPNYESFQSLFFKSRWRSAIEDHMGLFGKRSLIRLLKEEGYRILKTRTWGGLALGAGMLCIKPLLDRAAKFFGFGDVMIVLVRKAPP